GLPGVAWRVRILPLRVGWSELSAPSGYIDMLFVTRAIRYATRTHADILNCSFETLNTDGLDAAVDDAGRGGVVMVSGSGNGGPHALALRPGVIAVAAPEPDDHVYGASNLGDFVALSAPGFGLISTGVAHAGTDSLGARTPAYEGDLAGT